jgi:E3 ubiquitin-protein ligase RNF1/2
VLATLNKSCSQAALISSIEEGVKMQSQNKPQRSRKTVPNHNNANNNNNNNNSEVDTTPGGANSMSATPTPSAPSTPPGITTDSNSQFGSAQKNNNINKRPKLQSENESGGCSNSESSYPEGSAESAAETTNTSTSSTLLSSSRIDKEFEVELKPHPDEQIRDVKYLKAPGMATSGSYISFLDCCSEFLLFRLVIFFFVIETRLLAAFLTQLVTRPWSVKYYRVFTIFGGGQNQNFNDFC